MRSQFCSGQKLGCNCGAIKSSNNHQVFSYLSAQTTISLFYLKYEIIYFFALFFPFAWRNTHLRFQTSSTKVDSLYVEKLLALLYNSLLFLAFLIIIFLCNTLRKTLFFWIWQLFIHFLDFSTLVNARREAKILSVDNINKRLKVYRSFSFCIVLFDIFKSVVSNNQMYNISSNKSRT